MKAFSRKLQLRCLLAISALGLGTACAITNEFCLRSGYEKDSVGYKNCAANYDANADLYRFCQIKRGITTEGPNLSACLEEAADIRSSFQEDSGFCNQEAGRKFAGIAIQPRTEKQATLNPDGSIGISTIALKETFGQDKQNELSGQYVVHCLSALGWNNAGQWQDEKRDIPVPAVTAALSKLNKEQVLLEVPEHASVQLFSAVSAGNVYQLQQIVARGVNVDTPNYQGYTALHVAARQGNFQMVQTLVEELGANIDAIAQNGRKPVAMAPIGRDNVARYLSSVMFRREHHDDHDRHDRGDRKDWDNHHDRDGYDGGDRDYDYRDNDKHDGDRMRTKGDKREGNYHKDWDHKRDLADNTNDKKSATSKNRDGKHGTHKDKQENTVVKKVKAVLEEEGSKKPAREPQAHNSGARKGASRSDVAPSAPTAEPNATESTATPVAEKPSVSVPAPTSNEQPAAAESTKAVEPEKPVEAPVAVPAIPVDAPAEKSVEEAPKPAAAETPVEAPKATPAVENKPAEPQTEATPADGVTTDGTSPTAQDTNDPAK